MGIHKPFAELFNTTGMGGLHFGSSVASVGLKIFGKIQPNKKSIIFHLNPLRDQPPFTL
jgi:hypothetical protein